MSDGTSSDAVVGENEILHIDRRLRLADVGKEGVELISAVGIDINVIEGIFPQSLRQQILEQKTVGASLGIGRDQP